MKFDQIDPLKNSEQNRPDITEDIRLKVVIAGEAKIGKSTIYQQYCYGHYQ